MKCDGCRRGCGIPYTTADRSCCNTTATFIQSELTKNGRCSDISSVDSERLKELN